METVKKTFEEPTVQKVEVDFKSRIAASGKCSVSESAGCDQEY
jgi:hypothetical protein